MGALWIAHVTVTDDAAYAKYAELASNSKAKPARAMSSRGFLIWNQPKAATGLMPTNRP